MVVLTAWQLTFPRVCDLRERNRTHFVFYDLILNVTRGQFHNILLVTQFSSIQSGKGLHKNVNTRKQELLGTLLETGFHT